MKNIIPMVLAVILAAAAVFAVSRVIKPKDSAAGRPMVEVVAAAKAIAPDSVIQESWLVRRRVDAASVPAKVILWREANRVVGQKAARTVTAGDYLLLSDVAGMTVDFDMMMPEGEWAVPITFADGAIMQFLQPGMEIAIIGTFASRDKVEKLDASENGETVQKESLSVVFPCVRILDLGRGDGIRRERGAGGGTVIVSMPPQKAMMLIAAQRKMDLYPVLRRRADKTAMRRRDVGLVDESTFFELKKGLEPIIIPDGDKPVKSGKL